MRRDLTLDRGFLVGMALVVGMVWWVRDGRYEGADSEPPTSTASADFGGAGSLLRVRADGRPVRFADFRGAPLLVVYGAEWSRDSAAQLAAVRAAAPPGLAVIHVVTSTAQGYGHPATVETAAAWAAHFQLPAADVIAADLSAKTLPAVALFDAQGRLLAERSGLQDEAALRTLLQEHRVP